MIDFFFARQPVLDARQCLFGYELLFRNSDQNVYDSEDGNRATLEILSNALFYSSFQHMVSDTCGLVNFTRDLLLDNAILLFSPQNIIVEVLEDVVPDTAVVDACRKLKQAGYRIALDDFLPEHLNHPLLDIAAMVKVDFLSTQRDDRKRIADLLRPRNITLLAEKVETDADFREASSFGYDLFQGFFFGKPVITSRKQFAPRHIAGMRMLQAVFREPCDYGEICDIISSDISLSYKMLKLANSPFFGFRKEIKSIRHAITLLGQAGMRQFVSLLVVSNTGSALHSELAILGLTRGRMAEQMAFLIGCENEKGALFLTGLFSLLDSLMGCSMEEITEQLPIAQEIKDALLGAPNRLGKALHAIVAYERADWNEFARAAAHIGLPEERVPSIYAEAIQWASRIIRSG